MILLLACSLLACDASSTTQSVSAPTDEGSTSAAPTPSGASAPLQIVNQAREEIGTIQSSGTTQYISLQGMRLTGVLKGAKRKYQQGNQVVAEVKSADAKGFKLRNPDGSLRWKVKLYDDKVKISDNEENLNPFQIKTSDGKFKLKDAQEQEIGRITQEGETVFVTSEQQQFVLQAPYRMSYGVLLIPNMRQQDQFILLAELQDRGY